MPRPRPTTIAKKKATAAALWAEAAAIRLLVYGTGGLASFHSCFLLWQWQHCFPPLWSELLATTATASCRMP